MIGCTSLLNIILRARYPSGWSRHWAISESMSLTSLAFPPVVGACQQLSRHECQRSYCGCRADTPSPGLRVATLPSIVLPYSTGHWKPSVFDLGFPGLPDLQRLGSSAGPPTPRSPITPTSGAPDRAAARLIKPAAPELSTVALSSPLGSTPRSRGVARVMGSPPRAPAMRRIIRNSSKLRATVPASHSTGPRCHGKGLGP